MTPAVVLPCIAVGQCTLGAQYWASGNPEALSTSADASLAMSFRCRDDHPRQEWCARVYADEMMEIWKLLLYPADSNLKPMIGRPRINIPALTTRLLPQLSRGSIVASPAVPETMEKLDAVQHVHVEDRSRDDLENTLEVDPLLEKHITRKLDSHILPWLFVLWLLAFIDRSNIGNAKLDGLVKDLDLGGNKYNVALTVFYILYVLVDVPSNWLLKVVGGGHYIPLLAIAWGIVGTCIGAVKTYGGLIACRLLLGACEA
nr:putative transporter c11d3.18c [Quercus suber]